MIGNWNYGTGRRKSSVARVFIKKGSGQIVVNGRAVDEYFGRQTSIMVVRQPLVLTANDAAFDIKVNVHGGGESGQAGAVRHGITRALIDYDAALEARTEPRRLRDARCARGRAQEGRSARRAPPQAVQQALMSGLRGHLGATAGPWRRTGPAWVRGGCHPEAASSGFLHWIFGSRAAAPMRLKLLRRRLSVSAPRMIVRSHLPWPLRWIVAALVLGFSAALALWAFEFGKDIAGLDRGAELELSRLRSDVERLSSEREQAVSVANTAQSLLTAEKSALERLAQQMRQLEAENLSLKADLGFFERLLPTGTEPGLSIRGLQVQRQDNGQLRFQLLVMQAGPKGGAEFRGRYEFTLHGTLDGRPWVHPVPGGPQPFQLRQYARIEGNLEVPVRAVVKTVQVKLTDPAGAVRATQTTSL